MESPEEKKYTVNEIKELEKSRNASDRAFIEKGAKKAKKVGKELKLTKEQIDEIRSLTDMRYLKTFVLEMIESDNNISVLSYIKKHNPNPHILDELLKDKEVVLAAIKKDGFAFLLASPELQRDIDVRKAAGLEK